MSENAFASVKSTIAYRRLSEGAEDVIETSCAVIILKGTQAYKLKKPVDFGFLDYSTAHKRHEMLGRELVYNRRTAPDIYQNLDEIEGEPFLVMRRFDTAAVLSAMSLDAGWKPDAALLDNLGQTIAQFHAAAERVGDHGHGLNTHYTLKSNHRNIALFREALGVEAVDAYIAAMEAAFERLKPVLEARFDNGWIRRCHGDLHLGNILIEHNRPVLFDCIEFNEHLIQIDVLYDLAFILMDLWGRGLKAEANRIMNIWLEAMAREGEDLPELYAGLELLPFYLALRAGVRCHVHAHSAGADNLEAAQHYLKAGLAFLEAATPRGVAVGGLSGSGKSTYARQIAAGLGRPCGAVVLRSDEMRKRQWGCEPLKTLPPEAYAPEASARVYQEMQDLGAIALRAGQAVIFDATFRELQKREDLAAHVRGAGFNFEGIWLDVAFEVRLKRVASRKDDVSDATIKTVREQDDMPPPPEWRRVTP
jgi:uncharacterized protein